MCLDSSAYLKSNAKEVISESLNLPKNQLLWDFLNSDGVCEVAFLKAE